MNTKIYLQRGFFAENTKTIMENDEFKVNLFIFSYKDLTKLIIYDII